MNGTPDKLDRKEIIKIVPKHLIGNYWLGNIEPDNSFNIKYIGRSLKWDKNGLQKRLLDHASKRLYTHFRFREAQTIMEAYNSECKEYHRLRDQLDNIRHPDSPKGVQYDCYYCASRKTQDHSLKVRGVLHG